MHNEVFDKCLLERLTLVELCALASINIIEDGFEVSIDRMNATLKRFKNVLEDALNSATVSDDSMITISENLKVFDDIYPSFIEYFVKVLSKHNPKEIYMLFSNLLTAAVDSYIASNNPTFNE